MVEINPLHMITIGSCAEPYPLEPTLKPYPLEPTLQLLLFMDPPCIKPRLTHPLQHRCLHIHCPPATLPTQHLVPWPTLLHPIPLHPTPLHPTPLHPTCTEMRLIMVDTAPLHSIASVPRLSPAMP